MGKRIVFSTNDNLIFIYKKIKLGPYLTPYLKITQDESAN